MHSFIYINIYPVCYFMAENELFVILNLKKGESLHDEYNTISTHPCTYISYEFYNT